MNEHRIRFEGSAAAAVEIATAIADADGVDLTSSAPPTALADGRVHLELTVQGPLEVIEAAVEEVAARLPVDSTITVDAG